ncbi:helix-turn-helix domain-containing protein [uncultured Allomuricauda sp.]|uniref:helix-turn-helix domain-containing protein n=1 Tax=Flagellimonas sp. W118 TaxID=3410791 RepID=UPI002612BA4F|nr:helix-turn-helix domain-containing protein [uncultured Allomuricauda sp.]
MQLDQNLLFFFSALGAFNGLCLGFYFLLIAKPKHIASKFLGIMLLMLSVRTGKSVVFYFNPDLAFEFLQFGLTACFFIGPFLYFYVKSMVEQSGRINIIWKYHIAILLPFILILGYAYPFEQNIHLWRPYVIYGIYLQWFIYTVASGWIMRKLLYKALTQPKKITSRNIWLLSVFFGNLIIWAAYFFTNITYYIVGALTFSFLFYLLALLLFLGKKKNQNLFIPEQKYNLKKIDSTEASPMLERLRTLMDTEAPYTDPNLKSSDVAKAIKISVHQLSQLLNDNLNKSFPLFVNEYRIDKACETLRLKNNLTLEAIGYECGFNSKSTFFTTFKKIKGVTPSQYKSSLKGSYL